MTKRFRFLQWAATCCVLWAAGCAAFKKNGSTSERLLTNDLSQRSSVSNGSMHRSNTSVGRDGTIGKTKNENSWFKSIWPFGRAPEATASFERPSGSTESRRVTVDKRQGQQAMARLWEKRGQLQQAELLYTELLRDDPQDVMCHHRLGVVAARQGRFADAEQSFLVALRLVPSNPDILGDLGYCYYLQHRLDESERVLREGLNREPQNQAICNNLALTLGAQGRIDESMSLFRRVGSEAAAYANLAYVHAQRGKLQEAMKLYNHALTLDKSLKPAAEAMLQLASVEQVRTGAYHQQHVRSRRESTEQGVSPRSVTPNEDMLEVVAERRAGEAHSGRVRSPSATVTDLDHAGKAAEVQFDDTDSTFKHSFPVRQASMTVNEANAFVEQARASRPDNPSRMPVHDRVADTGTGLSVPDQATALSPTNRPQTNWSPHNTWMHQRFPTAQPTWTPSSGFGATTSASTRAHSAHAGGQ